MARMTSLAFSRCERISIAVSLRPKRRSSRSPSKLAVQSLPTPVQDASDLVSALDRFDESGAQRALDQLLMTLTLDVALRDVLLPYLHELGERWARGEATVAQEHFASNLVRGRLMALARSWDRGSGPRALLACVEGELHDLPLLCFGLVLRGHGWRISYLGADTPVASVVEAARALAPDAVVVSGTIDRRLRRRRGDPPRGRAPCPSLRLGGRSRRADSPSRDRHVPQPRRGPGRRVASAARR